MPPGYVRTIRDVIFYYYAKLVIAPSAGFDKNYRFITSRFNALKAGGIHLSDYDREIRKQMEGENRCVYCGSESNAMDHVVPRGSGGPESAHNWAKSCASCNSSKGERDLVDWWVNHLSRDKDALPRIPIGIYLKLSYDWHKIQHSLHVPGKSLFDLRPFKG